MVSKLHRLVIGLDYGTTFTGINYGVVKTENGKEVVEEFVYLDWHKGFGLEKVPSEISYSATIGGERQWGFDIAPGSLKFTWTKLELDQQARPDELVLILKALDGMKNLDARKIRETDGFPSYPAKDPVDIIAEYLTRVREYVKDNPPAGLHPTYLSTIPIDFIFTVPADWSDQAKDRTFRAISKAGFTKQNFPRLEEIILVAEPEAAALYTLRTQLEIEGDEFMVPGDCFVLCDAGGGTVDLIAYRIKQLRPSIQLEELTIGTGAKCGSTFIERNFMTWLEEKLGPEDFSQVAGNSPENAIGSHTIVGGDMEKIMREFRVIKHQFKGVDDPAKSYISLPHPLSMQHDPLRNIFDGELCVTGQDLQNFFEPSVHTTIDLIRAQIGLVEAVSKVKCVFLTGGFAQSKYLFKNVEDFTCLRGIRTRRPGTVDSTSQEEQQEHCLTAVMRGAVLRGIEKGQGNQVSVRKCRRHYGVPVSEPFSSFKHREQDSYIDPFDGEKKAQGQVDWLLKKGDALLSNKPRHASIDICRKFGFKDPRVFRTKLLVLDDDDAPQRYADIPRNRLEVIELVYDLSNINQNRFQVARAGARGQPYLCAHLKLEIRLETHLEFKVIFEDRELGNVVANYD